MDILKSVSNLPSTTIWHFALSGLLRLSNLTFCVYTWSGGHWYCFCFVTLGIVPVLFFHECLNPVYFMFLSVPFCPNVFIWMICMCFLRDSAMAHCSFVDDTCWVMRYTQAHVYTCCSFSLAMCKDIPWIGVDSLLTSFSSHDPGD